VTPLEILISRRADVTRRIPSIFTPDRLGRLFALWLPTEVCRFVTVAEKHARGNVARPGARTRGWPFVPLSPDKSLPIRYRRRETCAWKCPCAGRPEPMIFHPSRLAR